jgi:hypothetical protein
VARSFGGRRGDPGAAERGRGDSRAEAADEGAPIEKRPRRLIVHRMMAEPACRFGCIRPALALGGKIARGPERITRRGRASLT